MAMFGLRQQNASQKSPACRESHSVPYIRCTSRSLAASFPSRANGPRLAHTALASNRNPAVSLTSVVEAPTAVAAAEETQAPPTTQQEGLITSLTPENFEAFLLAEGSTGLVMVDFYADFCGPCKLALPHYEKMTLAFTKMRFAKFNCTTSKEHEAIAARHRIKTLPTFKLYRGGRFLEEITGCRPVQMRQMLIHHNW